MDVREGKNNLFYKNDRAYSSLGYLTPAEFARQYYEKNQAEEATQPGARSNSMNSLIVSVTKSGGTPLGDAGISHSPGG